MIIGNIIAFPKTIMKKLSWSLIFVFFVGNCFAQTTINSPDTVKARAALQSKKTDSVVVESKADLSIYPNPAKDKVTLQVKGFTPGQIAVKILDTKGKLLREDSRLLTNGSEDVIMFLMLPPGIYFVIVSQQGKVSRKKILMQ